MSMFLNWAHAFYSSTQLTSITWSNVTKDTYNRDSLAQIIEEIETKFLPGVVLQTFYTECEYYPQLHPTSIYGSLDTTNIPKWVNSLEMKLTYALLPPKVKVEIPEAIPNIIEYGPVAAFLLPKTKIEIPDAIFEPLPKEEPIEDEINVHNDIAPAIQEELGNLLD